MSEPMAMGDDEEVEVVYYDHNGERIVIGSAFVDETDLVHAKITEHTFKEFFKLSDFIGAMSFGPGVDEVQLDFKPKPTIDANSPMGIIARMAMLGLDYTPEPKNSRRGYSHTFSIIDEPFEEVSEHRVEAMRAYSRDDIDFARDVVYRQQWSLRQLDAYNHMQRLLEEALEVHGPLTSVKKDHVTYPERGAYLVVDYTKIVPIS